MMTRLLPRLLILAPVFIFGACEAVPSVKPSDIKLNPNPKQKYEVTATVQDVPGPLVPVTLHVHYTTESAGSGYCYPPDSFSGASTRKPENDADFPLTRVGDNLYKGVIYADYFQDAIYFKGHPPCHWIVNTITATFKGNGAKFEGSADVDWHPTATTYFMKKEYDTPPKNGSPAASPARGGFGWPSTDLWTVEMKVTPAAPESPPTGQAAERSAKQRSYSLDSEGNAKRESDVQALATGGAKVLAEGFDDINNDNAPDAVVVLDPPSGQTKSVTTLSRTLIVLTGDTSGNLKIAEQNSKIIPCASCNGALGDPFSFLRTFSGAFQPDAPLNDTKSRLYGFDVFVEGGAPEHWWNMYTFNYSTEQKDWMLYKVYRGIVDTKTGKRKEAYLKAKDFGAIKFEDFDPAKLPQLVLP